jgi:hypothetical protein
MARDKQIVIRIEDEKREDLKKYCSERNVEVGKLLYDIIGKLLDGSLTIDSATDSQAIQPTDLGEVIAQQIAQQLTELKLGDRLDSLENDLAKIKK